MFTTTNPFQATLDEIRQSGLHKEERIISSPQNAAIAVQGSGEVLNFCANNYLGLANHPEVIAAAQEGLIIYGFGLS